MYFIYSFVCRILHVLLDTHPKINRHSETHLTYSIQSQDTLCTEYTAVTIVTSYFNHRTQLSQQQQHFFYFCHTCHISKWFVLSSRPAASLVALFLKSSYPSPPLMTNIREANVVVAAMEDRLCMSCNAMVSLMPPSSYSPSVFTVGGVRVISTQVKNLTCPVCPFTNPVNNVKEHIKLMLYTFQK